MKTIKKYFLKVWQGIHWICWICRIIEFLRIPRFVDIIHGEKIYYLVWHICTSVEPLEPHEIEAAQMVFKTLPIQYKKVRIAEGRLLSLIFKTNNNRAFTTFHTINLPKSGDHSRSNADIIVHELTHVYQYQYIGSVYMCQALRAQRETEASGKRYIKYNYGDDASDKQWKGLEEYHREGWKYKFYNREQQAQIVQDYYNLVIENKLGSKDDVQEAYRPFIEELRNGEL
jgi:hypothetical protein